MPVRILLAVLTIGFVGSAAPAEEPEFNGRKLSAWVNQLREDTVPRKRRAAVVAIGQIASNEKDSLPVALQALGRALRTDAAAPVREQAATALGQLKIEETAVIVPDLAESLRIEQDPAVRKAVAGALGRFGRLAKPAVLPLTGVLKDKDPAVRAAAADALGRVGPDARGAVPELLTLLDDPAVPVRTAAVFALGRVEPEDTAPPAVGLVKRLTDDTEPAVRREALVSLGFLGDRSPGTLRAIATVLKDNPDSEMRQQAALALARFGTAAKAVTDQLAAAAAADGITTVRVYALRALASAHPGDAARLIPQLTERLRGDPDFEVRVVAAEELGALGADGKGAVPALRDARRDEQIKVREAAAAALKRIEAPPPAKKAP